MMQLLGRWLFGEGRRLCKFVDKDRSEQACGEPSFDRSDPTSRDVVVGAEVTRAGCWTCGSTIHRDGVTNIPFYNHAPVWQLLWWYGAAQVTPVG